MQNLRIDPDGHVVVPGGWMDLQQPIALDLYGFGLEITRIGFGTEEDGRRWIGVDGALRLTELLPAGASARGLRVIWDPADPNRAPSLALDGVGVSFGVPDAFAFEGEVALTEDPATGARLFTGALALGLDALDIGIDAGITVGRLAPDTYVFVHLGVGVPIPLGATGTALYGFEGLFAMNMSPVVTNRPWPSAESPTVPAGDWYGWYKHVPQVFTVTDPLKWSADPGAWAFGAGLSLGTLPDAGFTVNTRALLVILLPGPVLLLEGTADLLTPPPALGGAEQEGTLSLLAALDGRAGTLQLGIDAAWSLARVIDIGASTEAFFDFDRSDAWHLWIGQDQPETARIRADYLALFHADAWLMLGPPGIDAGVGVSWGDTWRFSPARLTLEAWVGGRAALTTRPQHLSGGLSLGGHMGVAVGPFGIGIGVEAALSGESFTPYEVAGTLSVVVELPTPLKDLDVDIGLSWQQPATPGVEDPWVSALVDHPRCTESWQPVDGGGTDQEPASDTPVVPLDAGVLLTFAHPMGDETGLADNPPVGDPTIPLGEHDSSYAVTRISLHRRRRSHPEAGWEDVTDSAFGTWTPDADGAGSRLQLLTRSPFAFTRFTSRRWVDDFVGGNPDWPCLPEPVVVPVCLDWTDLALSTPMPAIWEQDGVSFSSNGALFAVQNGELGRVLRLGPAEEQGQPRAGALWAVLPEPASRVTALVDVPSGDWVWMRAWSNGVRVGQDSRFRGAGVLDVSAADIDTVTLDWGFNTETELARLCWTPQRSSDELDAWTIRREGLETAAERWDSAEPLLDPDTSYLLKVTTRALLTKGGTQVQLVERTHTVQFQTAGPPGIVPQWVPAPPADATAATTGFPHGGVLKDLAAYVQWTIPDAGAAPVFRAYDLGCEFDASSVQQMYGADLTITVHDRNGRPLRDADGEVRLVNAWEEGPTTTLSSSESAWLSVLSECTQAVDLSAVQGDDVVRVTTPAGFLLPARQALTARLEASRPLFTDAFEDLAAFDTQVLATQAPVTTCSASGGVAMIARPKTTSGAVVALAGDPGTADYTIECTVSPAAQGMCGLVTRHAGPDSYLSLELTTGVGRKLVAHQGSGSGKLVPARILWQDDTPVDVGDRYALSLTCTGSTVAGSVDGVEFSAAVTSGPGRFGLLSSIPSPDGCAFTDLVVRSAPRDAVHEWQFTTSAHPGLPELMATFVGTTWPVDDAAVDRAATTTGAADAAARLSAVEATVDVARAELASAAAGDDVLDLVALRSQALAAVTARHEISAEAFRDLSAALGLPYRPLPPVVELSQVVDDGDIMALLLDLPEPLPWERMSWSLSRQRRGRQIPAEDAVLVWSEDGARAVLVQDDGAPWLADRWTLTLTLALDIGAERAAWRRDGSQAPEVAEIVFTTGRDGAVAHSP